MTEPVMIIISIGGLIIVYILSKLEYKGCENEYINEFIGKKEK